MANAIPVHSNKGKKSNESKDSSPVQSSEGEVPGVVGQPEVTVPVASVSPEGVVEVHPEFGVLHANGRAYVKHSN